MIFSDESSFSSTQSANEVAQGLEDTLRKEMKSAPNNSIAQKLVLSIFQVSLNIVLNTLVFLPNLLAYLWLGYRFK